MLKVEATLDSDRQTTDYCVGQMCDGVVAGIQRGPTQFGVLHSCRQVDSL